MHNNEINYFLLMFFEFLGDNTTLSFLLLIFIKFVLVAKYYDIDLNDDLRIFNCR